MPTYDAWHQRPNHTSEGASTFEAQNFRETVISDTLPLIVYTVTRRFRFVHMRSKPARALRSAKDICSEI
jgi:hypothetical protein